MTRKYHKLRKPVPTLVPIKRIETGADGYKYEVWVINKSRTIKAYRCPGCDQAIQLGTKHIVTLPIDINSNLDRRHWHTSCWNNRINRRPTRKWS